jgi:HEAT repeat protein
MSTLLLCAWLSLQATQAETRQSQATPAQVSAAIEQLSPSLEYPIRTAAARTIRRAAATVAVPALTQAVASHKDGYIRFRALVLLSGFNDARTGEVMARVLTDPNDRLRTVAYAYFEFHPDAAVLPRLIDALAREESEFVRPPLTRAIAAHGKEKAARDAMSGLVMRGQDFFRSAVIEAIGDYKGAYAFDALTTVARQEGPLQDDAVLALGKIGDKRALETFAGLQRSAPKSAQPAIAAAICLLGVNCSSHQSYLTDSLKFGIKQIGYQELVRSAAAGLAAIAVNGNEEALRTLIELGAPARDPARAAITLAIGTVALRNTPLTLTALQAGENREAALDLLREAFDMLEEDYVEERFFATVRRGYWQAAAGSPGRAVAEALIRKLEF